MKLANITVVNTVINLVWLRVLVKSIIYVYGRTRKMVNTLLKEIAEDEKWITEAFLNKE